MRHRRLRLAERLLRGELHLRRFLSDWQVREAPQPAPAQAVPRPSDPNDEASPGGPIPQPPRPQTAALVRDAPVRFGAPRRSSAPLPSLRGGLLPLSDLCRLGLPSCHYVTTQGEEPSQAREPAPSLASIESFAFLPPTTSSRTRRVGSSMSLAASSTCSDSRSILRCCPHSGSEPHFMSPGTPITRTTTSRSPCWTKTTSRSHSGSRADSELVRTSCSDTAIRAW